MKQRQRTSFAFGRQVLHLRERAGLTQRALAHILGLSARAVLNWESGASYPDPARLRQLITVFVQQRAFPEGDEEAAAAALWNLAQTHARRRMLPLDPAWLTALVQSMPASAGAALTSGDLPAPQGPGAHRINEWGEAGALPALVGREAELALLETWISDDGCRLVSVLGIGGMGKTALVTTLARRLAPTFSRVFWRSLWNAPPLDQVLEECLRAIGDAVQPLPTDLDGRLAQLLVALRQRRCLLVLDNMESLLQEGTPGGNFRPGYEAYAALLARVGAESHASCLVITSREQPPGLVALTSPQKRICTLRLGSLAPAATAALLAGYGLLGATGAWEQLCARYGGNPLALKLAAAPIRELFAADIDAFLAADAWLVNDVRQLLDAHVRRLAPHEHTLLTWLAIAREPVAVVRLLERVATPISRTTVVNSVEGLHRRALIERGSDGALALQPVVLDYVTARLLETLSSELSAGVFDLLRQYPLAQTTVPAYVRHTQLRVLVDPVLHHLRSTLGSDDAVRQTLDDALARLRGEPFAAQGYASSTIVTLRARLAGDLRRYDLGGLALREVDFSAMYLQYAMLSQAQITDGIFAEPFDTVASLACSPDGRFFASGAYNGDVRIWDRARGTPQGQCRGHSGGVHAVAWSPDGACLASGGSDMAIWLWQMPSGQQRGILVGSTAPLRTLAWSPDGNLLASAGSDGHIRIWHVASSRCVREVDSGCGDVYTLAWSADGCLLASGGSDHALRLWRAADLHTLEVLTGHTGTVFAIAFSPAGTRLASASYDGSLRVWDTGERRCLASLRGHTHGCYALAWHPDGRVLASGGGDGTLRLWDWEDGGDNQLLGSHHSAVYALAYCGKGRLLVSGGGDRTIRLWDTATRRCQQVLTGYANDVYAVAFRPDSADLACGAADHAIRVWDTRSGACREVLVGHSGDVLALAWSPDGRWLASGGYDDHVRVWAADEAEYRLRRTHRAGTTNTLAWRPDGAMLAAGGDGVTVWDAQRGQMVLHLDGHTAPVRVVAWSPNGRWLASGGYDGTVRVWDVEHGAYWATLHGHHDFVYALAWSPDGQLLASGGYDRTVQLWDVRRGERVLVLDGHTSPLRTLAWSPDGALLASAGYDPTVVLWATDTWQHQVVNDHDSLVFSLAWSTNGETLAVGRAGGWITLWNRATFAPQAILRCGRLYEQLRIDGVSGLSTAQRATLLALGAVER